MNLRKAAEMALEVLTKWKNFQHKESKAIAALKEALAQPEQEPYAYTAEGECWWNRFTNYAMAQAHLDGLRIPEERRLYLYLHPAPIPEGRQLVPIEPTKTEKEAFASFLYDKPHGSIGFAEVWTAACAWQREALAQPEQEPVAKVYRYGSNLNGEPWHGIHWFDAAIDAPDGTLLYLHPAPKPEEWDSRELGADEAYVSISETPDEEINAALAQPEQEPVATITIEYFRGLQSMQNVDCEMLTQLAAGTYQVYLHPAPIPEGWQLVNRNMTPEQRQLMLRAEEFTVDEMWIILLAAAPKLEDL